MAMFEFLKKKDRELPLPPPPSAPKISPLGEPPHPIRGDFENIRPQSHMDFPAPAPAEEKEVSVFDKTIPQEAVEAHELVETVRSVPNPAFIAVEDYKRIVNDTNSIRAHLMNAEGFAKQLSDLKSSEERAIERWRSHLEDVEKKLSYVDQLIEKA